MSYATLVGFTVFRNQAGSSVFYTPPIVREALTGIFSLEATHFICSGDIVVDIEHKDFADTSWVTADTFPNISGTGVETLMVGALKEEIRLKFSFSGGGPGEFGHFVVSAVEWIPE